MISEEQLVEELERKYKDLRVTISDLKHPSAKFLQQYFMAFFEEFGADVSAFLEPTPEQLQGLEYPVAFKTVLPIMNYFCAVKYILQYIARDLKISITDLTEPNPGKTKALIIVTEKFYSYADTKAARFIALEEKMLQKKEFYNQLFHEVEILKETINKVASETAQMQLYKQQLTEKSAAQDVMLTELQMQAMKLDEDNKDMEAEMINCKNVLDETEAEKAQLEETVKELEFKVSQLPTEATLAAVKEKRMKLSEEVTAAAKRVEEKCNRVADVEKKIKLWEKIHCRLEEVVALSQELQSKKTELEALEKQQALEEEKREAEAEKCTKLRAKIAQHAEKRFVERAQWLERKALLVKKIEEEKRKNEMLRKAKDEEQKQLKEIEQQILKKNEEHFRLIDENKKMCRKYDEKFMKLAKEHEEILFQMTGKKYDLCKSE